MTTDQDLNTAEALKQRLDEMLTHIEDLMSDEQYSQAQVILNHALKLGTFDLRLYERYAFIMRMEGLDKAAELLENVIMNPNDIGAYYNVAVQFLQERLFGAAINPLQKIVEIAPQNANANFQLGYSYLKEFDLERALHYFQIAYDLDQSPTTSYYVAYTHLLLGHLETTKSLLPALQEAYETSGEPPHMLKILRDMIERYEAFPPQTVRDWHFVQYGTPLLRTSDDDFDEPNKDLNGRYVFINYGFLTVARVLQTLKRMIEEVECFPKYEYIIPASPAIAPMAFAFSEMMNIPLAHPDALQTESPGLVFCAWTGDVDRVAQSVVNSPRVTTFAFSMGWTLQAALCPEVIGYLDQANRLPWEETVLLGENGEQTHRPAMEQTPEEIGKLISERLPEVSKEELDAVIAYYQERAHLLKIGDNQNSPRLGFQIESPVQSFRMMI